MSRQQTDNCGQCAYVEKGAQGMWCPFHDEAVSERLVCDYFMDEYEAPLYTSLADDNVKVGVSTVVKDIIGYVLIGGLILLDALYILSLILS